MSAQRGATRRQQREHRRRRLEEERALELLDRADRSADVPGRLPLKFPTVHRYVLVAAYAMTEQQLRDAQHGAAATLDVDDRFTLCVACWDCGRPLASAPLGSPCPAGSHDG